MDHHTNHHNEGNNNSSLLISNHPYYQPRVPMNRGKSHEDICLQRMVGLREQHSKSTQQLMTQLNLAKELVKERVVIKESARRREPSTFDNDVTNTQNYSASADEVQQMRRQNRLGKTSLAAMKYLSSVDHRRSSSLLGVNTIIHKKKPVNCTENIQYCQDVEDEAPLEEEIESVQPPIQKTIVVNINDKIGSAKRSSTQSNLLHHQHSSSELKKI